MIKTFACFVFFSWDISAYLSIRYLAIFSQDKQKSSQRKIHKSLAKQFVEIPRNYDKNR